MKPSGERLVPEASDSDVRNEHLARYRFAVPLARDRRVLDAGCGVGYGAALLTGGSAAVYALDNASDAVRQGKGAYPDVTFVQGDCEGLPFAADSLDLIVAFEVIEHLDRWADLIREAARVLTPAGVFLVSTPNRAYYQTTRTEPNPFHVHEFAYAEFCDALASTFAHRQLFFENHAQAIAISSDSAQGARAHVETASLDPTAAHFFVAACSMRPIEGLQNLAYLPDAGNVLRERELHVAKLEEWVATLESRHATVEGRMSRELARLPYRILRGLRLAPPLPRRWPD